MKHRKSFSNAILELNDEEGYLKILFPGCEINVSGFQVKNPTDKFSYVQISCPKETMAYLESRDWESIDDELETVLILIISMIRQKYGKIKSFGEKLEFGKELIKIIRDLNP